MLLYIFSELPVSGSQANPSACSSGLVQRYLAPTCTCMNPRAEAQVDKNRVLKKKKKEKVPWTPTDDSKPRRESREQKCYWTAESGRDSVRKLSFV